MRALLYSDWHNTPTSVGLLLLRLVMGAAFLMHGWPKIQQPFGWMGQALPGVLQLLAAVAEFGGGVALILGLLTRLGALGIAVTMAVALGMVHLPHGDPFVAAGKPSFEPAAFYLGAALLFLLAGPGRLSLDAWLFGRAGRAPRATL
jgi:putative oxidoreductase